MLRAVIPVSLGDDLLDHDGSENASSGCNTQGKAKRSRGDPPDLGEDSADEVAKRRNRGEGKRE
jgi:hypothetical protein